MGLWKTNPRIAGLQVADILEGHGHCIVAFRVRFALHDPSNAKKAEIVLKLDKLFDL